MVLQKVDILARWRFLLEAYGSRFANRTTESASVAS